MIKAEGLEELEQKMKSLDPESNEIYEFLGCERGNKFEGKTYLKEYQNQKELMRKYSKDRKFNEY